MKRIPLLLVVVVLLSLLTLVAGSALAAPATQPPGPVPHPTIVSSPSPSPVPLPIEPASQWKNICSDPDKLVVTVKGDNILLYECIGTSLYGWSELCDEKAGIGYTDDGPGISVTCGI